jgi:hypothetical protein
MQFIIRLVNEVNPSVLRGVETLNVMQRIEALGPIEMVMDRKKGRKVPRTDPNEVEVIEGIITDLVAYIEEATGTVPTREKMFIAIEKMREHSHRDYKFHTVNMSLAQDVWSADHLGFGHLIFEVSFENPKVAYQKLLGPERLCKEFPPSQLRAPTLDDYQVRGIRSKRVKMGHLV